MYGQGQGQMPGQQYGQAPNNRDPLGRSMYNQGGADLCGERVPTELDLGKARAILEELQRRAERAQPAEPTSSTTCSACCAASERGAPLSRAVAERRRAAAGLRRSTR